MAEVHFRNEHCDCPAGRCAHFVEPDSSCINRLTGDVRTMRCAKHLGWTWHQDGRCLRCAESGKDASHG